MLRPERMSKVSVTGTKDVMTEVIEAVHDLHLVHLSDYDGSWEGFENGRPVEGAEDASERLVTIRSLERTLDLDTDVAPPTTDYDRETIDERLEAAREAITSVEDDLSAAREERRDLEDRIDRLEPFATLGIDLDLLQDYDTLDVSVGRGRRDRIAEALEADETIDTFEIFGEGDVLGIFASSTGEASDPIQDALVGVEFDVVEIPDGTGDPSGEIRDLRNELGRCESEIDALEADLDGLRHEYGDFLRGAERQLAIEVDQAEAPLRFATSDHAFVAEGWIPSESFERLEATLADAVGDRVEVEELRTAPYGDQAHDHEENEEQAVATDGGTVTMDEQPPVKMDNPTIASPFELLTAMVNRPKYGEIDPTLAVFLTFPLAFGFMIGDIAYGLLYVALGWYLLRYDSTGVQIMGKIAMWCGGFTILFGFLFGEFTGIHLYDFGYNPLVGDGIHVLEGLGMGALDKGVQDPDWLLTWILASLFFGWFHLNLGLVIRFVNELAHGWRTAIFEAGSWILAMNGWLLWLFSHRDAGGVLGLGIDLTAGGAKPAQFFGADSVIAHTGFVGFPEAVGVLGLVALVVGLVMVGMAEGVAGLAESPAWILGHFLSYLRIVAVLLGKGAMAFVVNLIIFGAYVPESGSYADYVLFNLPGVDIVDRAGVAGMDQIDVAFAGLWNIDPLVIPIAIVIFVFGHAVVLLLGITAAGIQMLRLEYVEFFQKFFQGGGRRFVPFGRAGDSS